MYFWKCWRDTRLKFFIFLAIFLCLELAFLISPKGNGMPLNSAMLRAAFLFIFIATGSVLVFVGWILGDDNAGADIGRGSGDFLLTRPASRGSFVWTGWGVSMVEMIVLWIIFSAIAIADVFSESRRLGLSGASIASALLNFLRHDAPLVFLIFLINVGLIFGVTYFLGVVLRSGTRALIGSAALILGYRVLQAILAFRFRIVIPDILLSYPIPHRILAAPAIHDFIVRGLVALAFPLLAHLILERMEI